MKMSSFGGPLRAAILFVALVAIVPARVFASTPPVIGSATTALALAISPFSYQIVASGAPTSYGAAPMPPGLSFNMSTGLISGTPTTTGNYAIGLSATNSFGTGTSTLTLTVGMPLTLTSGLNNPFHLTLDSAGNPVLAEFSSGRITRVAANSGATSTLASNLATPWGTAYDSSGHLYITLYGGSVLRMSPAGAISTLATLNGAGAVVVDTAGNAIVCAFNSNAVVRVTPTGGVTTVASGINVPTGLVYDSGGNLYVASKGDGAIYKITPGGVKTTFATGLSRPEQMAFDSAGNLYVANEVSPGVVSKISPSGVVSTFLSGLARPRGVAIDHATGTMYVTVWDNSTLLRVGLPIAPTITTTGNSLLAVSGTPFNQTIAASGLPAPTFTATGLPSGLSINYTTGVISGTTTAGGTQPVTITATNSAGSAHKTFTLTVGAVATFVSGFYQPLGLNFDSAGNLVVSQYGSHRIDKVSPAGVVSPLVSGIVGPFTQRYDASGNLYVTLYGANTLVRVSPSGSVATVASGLNGPSGLAVTSTGAMVVTSFGSHVVYSITPAGAVSTLASVGSPIGAAYDAGGNLYIASRADHTVKRITPQGAVSTFATGLNTPEEIVFDAAGNLYVANFGDDTVKKISPGGVVSTFATGFSGPRGLAFDSAGALHVSSWHTGLIHRIAGPIPPTITTTGATLLAVSGTAFQQTITATGSPAPTFAAMGLPAGLSINSTTGLISGTTTAVGNHAVTVIANNSSGSTNRVFTLSVGTVHTYASSGFGYPYGLAFDSAGVLHVTNAAGGNVVKVSSSGSVTGLAGGLPGPVEADFDSSGNLFVTNYDGGTISKIAPSGAVTTLASGFSQPRGGVFDAAGDYYFGSWNTNTIYQMSPSGAVTPFKTGVSQPTNFAFDAAGNLWVAQWNIGLSRISPAGVITWVANIGGNADGLAIDSAGNAVVADFNGAVKRVSPSGVVTTIASGFGQPRGLALDSTGAIYLAISGEHRIVRIGVPLLQPPVINSPASAHGTVGLAFNYSITATNNPTSFSAAGLPANLSLNHTSGLINGTPALAGSFTIGLAASNAAGTGTGSTIFMIAKGTATVTLSNLTRTYTGSPLTPTATTNPASLNVGFTFNGSSTAPTNAGSYSLLATINDANYNGSASGTFTISPASATVTLGNLTQPYDGSPKSVSVTTTPGGLATTVTYNGSTTAPSAVGSYNVVATITNPNYTGSATGTLTITDTVPPVITVPPNLTLEATSAAGAVATFSATATDNVDGPVPVTLSPASGSVFAVGTTLVTATATDTAGNKATRTFTVTVQDATKPALTAPSEITAEATSAAGAVVTFSASATDNVGFSVFSSGFEAPMRPSNTYTYYPQGAVFGDWRSKYPAGLINGSRPDWRPDTAPSGAQYAFIQINQSLNLVGGIETVNSYALSAGQPYTLAFYQSTRPQVFGPQIGGAVTYTITLVNASGSTEIFRRTTTTAEPWQPYAVSFTPPASGSYRLAFTAVGQGTGDDTFFLDDVRLLSATGTVVASPASGSTFPLGTTTVTLTATDAANNVQTGSFNVTVKDSTKPVVAVPADIVAEATSAAGAVVSFTATATDSVSTPTVISTPSSGSTFALGTTTVNVIATDAAGNSATNSFTVTVRDTTVPVITAPADITAEATSAAGAAVSFSATATDIVDGAVSVTASPASGSTFALGTTTVQLTATDASGNTATSSFTITVKDTTAPAIVTPADVTAEATSAAGTVVTFSATASDLVDGAVSVSASPASGSTFPLGTTTVTLTAKDAANNTATSTFTITVVDTTKPALTLPASQTLEATSGAGAVANYTATATDAVGVTSFTQSPASGSTFALGTTTVTLTAQDAAGNTSTGTFTITVEDTTKPALTLPADQKLEATSESGAVANFTATATDAVGVTSLTYSKAPGSTFAIGTTTVTVTAKDAAGNTATGSFTITVEDTTKPALTLPADQALEATGSDGAVANFTATASDAVGVTSLTYSKAPGSTFAIGTTNVTVTAKDAAGNTAIGTFTVTVRDTTKPVLTSVTPSITEIWPPNNKMVAVTLTAVASDAVGLASLKIISVATNEPDNKTQWQITGDLTLNLLADRAGKGSSRIYTITVEARDAAGNASTKTCTVTVPHDRR